MSRQVKIIGSYAKGNIFEGGWYQNSDYYITGKTSNDKYIATLSNVVYGDVGTIKVFNNVRKINEDTNIEEPIITGNHVEKGIFKYQFSDNNDWNLSRAPNKEVRDHSMHVGGSKRRRKTRKSRKVKRRKTRRVKRRY